MRDKCISCGLADLLPVNTLDFEIPNVFFLLLKKKMVQITPFHLRSAGFSDPGKRSNYFGPGSNVELHSFGTNLIQRADDDDNEAVG